MSVYQSDLFNRIRAEVDKVKLVDTHEHLTYPDEFAKLGEIDFGRLFLHYSHYDMRSAGMPQEDMERLINAIPGWNVEEKWRALKPWYQKGWNTGYCEALRIAMRDLYGVEDLADDTVDSLSEKMNSVPRDTWLHTVFGKANIDIAMQQRSNVHPVYHRKRYPEIFVYDMGDFFSDFQIETLSKDSGIEVSGFSDYLKLIDWYFDSFAEEATAFKIGRAYDRTLSFEDVAYSDAERLFSRYLKSSESLSHSEVQAMEDFIVHYCVQKSMQHDLPVKIHTGLQEGAGNDIRNSRAALLINIFQKYPKAKFDIYHISWPYTEELINICKNFPNVYIDFCWAWIFNPPASRRYLSDMLETVPLNKIHGFGGDSVFVEMAYGHSIIARREIARVLTEKVEEGRFTEDYAVMTAQWILRENAMENFRVEEKRKIFAGRVTQ